MNVLALLSDAYGGHGGIARYNRDLLTALARHAGIGRIVVLPRQGSASDAESPAQVHQFSPRGKWRYPFSALWLAARRGPFDAVFCGHLNLAPLAAIVARGLGVPLWLQLHGVEAWGPLTRWQIRAARRASLITAVSRYTRRHFLKAAPIDLHRIRILPNTVDEGFAPGPPRADLLERLDLTGKTVILTVGRLAADERRKGHDKIIRALPAIVPAHPDVSYLIVGTGDDRPRLEALATELGIADHVRFAGHVAADQLADHYRLAKAFVMPSLQEGFGIAFLEAAACGLALIGGNRDGGSDALADGTIGLTIDPENSDQLVAAIMTALVGAAPDPAQVRRYAFENFAGHLGALIDAHLRPSRTAAG